MANVDSKLWTSGDRSPADRGSEQPKRGIRGTAGAQYIGPVLSTAAKDYQALGDTGATSHATGIGGGGAEDSSGYRESDTYVFGTDTTAATATVRPNPGSQTERSVYRADGVQGGSVKGYPAQRSGQRAAAATGDSITAEAGAAAFIDNRSNIYGDGGLALGQAGRGTRVTSTGGTVTVTSSGVGQTSGQPRLPRPTVEDSDAPGAGVVGIIAGDDLFTCDLNAADITGGASGYAGVTVVGFLRGTDTDEDAASPSFKADFDSVTEANLITGLASATAYAMYVQFKDTAGNLGPKSARFVNTTT